MRGFTLGGFRFRFGIVFHTVHQQAAPAPRVAQAEPAAPAAEEVQEQETAAAANVQPDQGDAAPAVGGGEGEESLQLRRYVAEVSASAMAVEQLQREGRLDLQRNSTEEVEGWGEEEEEGEEEIVGDENGEEQVVEGEEEMVHETHGAADEAVAPSGTCDTETVKTEDGKCNSSSSTSHDGGEEELERLMDSSLLSRRLQESSSQQESLPPAQSNPSLLQEMRTSLVEAQEEATSLLRQIQGEEEEGGSEH